MAEEEQATAESAEEASPPAAEASPPAAEDESTVAEAESSVAEAPSLEGHKLDEMSGAQVGRISGVLAGESGEVEWLIARMGRFGHFCLVPARDLVSVNGRVWVPYSRDQIRGAPRVDPRAPQPDEVKLATAEHYGLTTPA